MKKSANTTTTNQGKVTFVDYLNHLGLSATSIYETLEGYYAEVWNKSGEEIAALKAFTNWQRQEQDPNGIRENGLKCGTILCRLAKADASNPDIVGSVQVDGVYTLTFSQYLAERGFLPDSINKVYETSTAYYAEVSAAFINPAYFTEVRRLDGCLKRVKLSKEDASNPAIVGQNRISDLFSVSVFKPTNQ